MPELPEVETIVRDLDGTLRGRSILDVQVLRPDLIAAEPADRFASALRDSRIERVSRRAKNIVLELSDQRLVVNLGMTGRMLVIGGDAPPAAHLGVRFALDDGRTLIYHDVRRFGRLRRFGRAAWMARAAELGIEPLGPGFTGDALLELSRRSRVAVKSWLMDQRRVVGIGNIYASEALFRAGIDPRRPAHSLDAADAHRLRDAVHEVLIEAIEFRGTTLLDYRDAQGDRGGFAARLMVYDRAGEPCPRCDAPLLRIVQGGRSTFFCAGCQR